MSFPLRSSSFETSSLLQKHPLLLPQHVLHQDPLVIVGLTRYPTTPGHVIVQCREDKYLMALDVAKFSNILLTVRDVASTVASVLHTHRCGLTYDGSGTISIIPLHGVCKEWKPILHGQEEYHATFPGCLTSKNGPEMAYSVLEETRDRVARVSGITEPFDNTFNGDAADTNIFARIIRGELPQWRVWENNSHVAFLTPYGNTPGFTVVVPRKHLGSDIFALSGDEYVEMVRAAYTVAQHLKEAFGVERCGMFFEGYEIDYAHVKLVPIHDRLTFEGQNFNVIAGAAKFQDTYQGYLTTQLGPLASDLDGNTAQAKAMRNVHAHSPDCSP